VQRPHHGVERITVTMDRLSGEVFDRDGVVMA
jgi:hypothetical protein